MKYIERETWKRKKHFDFFNAFDAPHFNVTTNVDVTELREFAKTSGHSFFKLFLYGAVKAANAIPEFRQRIRGDAVVEHDVVHPSFTVLRDDDLFNFCTVTFDEALPTFLDDVTTRMAQAGDEIVVGDEEPDDLLYVTSVPWVTFTSIAHPTNRQREDSVPRIAWGKFTEHEGRLVMPLSVQAHHALMDGVHIGRYIETLQRWLDEGAYREAFAKPDDGIAEATRLRENGQLEQAKQLLLQLLRKDEKNPRLHAHCAWCYDALGEERQAVPHYERAIRLGLTGEELAETYLGLGSTYRALGRYEEAETLLSEAIEKFPTVDALHAFRAMARYNLGRHEAAMGELLALLAKPNPDGSLARYRRALSFYAYHLNDIYD